MSITPAAPYDPNAVRSMHVPFGDSSAAAQSTSEQPNKPNPADASRTICKSPSDIKRLQALRERIGNFRPVFNTLLIGIVYCLWSEMDIDEIEDDYDKTLGGWCVVFAFLAQQCFWVGLTMDLCLGNVAATIDDSVDDSVGNAENAENAEKLKEFLADSTLQGMFCLSYWSLLLGCASFFVSIMLRLKAERKVPGWVWNLAMVNVSMGWAVSMTLMSRSSRMAKEKYTNMRMFWF